MLDYWFAVHCKQVQEFFNEDLDVIFDALVAADYIDEKELQTAAANNKHDSQRSTTLTTTSAK